jgi:hypothetical protein
MNSLAGLGVCLPAGAASNKKNMADLLPSLVVPVVASTRMPWVVLIILTASLILQSFHFRIGLGTP